MQYTQFSIKKFMGICFAASVVVACNSNQSSDTIADTASTPNYTSTDTATQATPVPGDTMAAVAPVDTAAASAITAAPAKTKRKGNATSEKTPSLKNPKIAMDKSGIYAYSEVAPAYPGGQTAIDNYINNHINYPQAALNDDKEGRVGISFVVNQDGTVTDAHEMGKKLGSGLDEEAVRVVSSMPHWIPGTVKGKPVKTRMTLPIIFKIEE